jgi:hypothetical protein
MIEGVGSGAIVLETECYYCQQDKPFMIVPLKLTGDIV